MSVGLAVCAFPDILVRALHSWVHSFKCRSLFSVLSVSVSVAKLPKEYLLLYAESVTASAANIRSHQDRDLTIATGNTVAKLLITRRVILEMELKTFGTLLVYPFLHHSYDTEYKKLNDFPSQSSADYASLRSRCPTPSTWTETLLNPAKLRQLEQQPQLPSLHVAVQRQLLFPQITRPNADSQRRQLGYRFLRLWPPSHLRPHSLPPSR